MDVMVSAKFAMKMCKFCTHLLCKKVQIMNEKIYKKRLDFQQRMISRQSEQIGMQKSTIERLENELKEKDKIINSVAPLRKELTENVKEQKRLKKEYKKLIQELKKMKSIVDQEVYRGRWWLIKFLLK